MPERCSGGLIPVALVGWQGMSPARVVNAGSEDIASSAGRQWTSPCPTLGVFTPRFRLHRTCRGEVQGCSCFWPAAKRVEWLSWWRGGRILAPVKVKAPLELTPAVLLPVLLAGYLWAVAPQLHVPLFWDEVNFYWNGQAVAETGVPYANAASWVAGGPWAGDTSTGYGTPRSTSTRWGWRSGCLAPVRRPRAEPASR